MLEVPGDGGIKSVRQSRSLRDEKKAGTMTRKRKSINGCITENKCKKAKVGDKSGFLKPGSKVITVITNNMQPLVVLHDFRKCRHNFDPVLEKFLINEKQEALTDDSKKGTDNFIAEHNTLDDYFTEYKCHFLECKAKFVSKYALSEHLQSHYSQSFSLKKVDTFDARHEKTDLKVFVVVIPKEGLACVATPILLLV